MGAVLPFVASRPGSPGNVGREPVSMSDAEREAAIKRYAELMELAMQKATAAGDDYLNWRGEADRMRLHMEALIRERNEERGLA